jgi:hypothetical protein
MLHLAILGPISRGGGRKLRVLNRESLGKRIYPVALIANRSFEKL